MKISRGHYTSLIHMLGKEYTITLHRDDYIENPNVRTAIHCYFPAHAPVAGGTMDEPTVAVTFTDKDSFHSACTAIDNLGFRHLRR